jgi:integrase
MDLGYKAKKIRFESGEENWILLDISTRMPVEEPALYMMTKLRVKGRQANTIENYMRAIAVLYTWCDVGAGKKTVNLSDRFYKGELLTEVEIASLADFCNTNFNIGKANEISTIKPKRIVEPSFGGSKITKIRVIKKPSVSPSSKYSRMTCISDYLEWLALRMSFYAKKKSVLSDRNDIRAMVGSFLEERSNKKETDSSDLKSLTRVELLEARRLFSVKCEENPFIGDALKLRNEIIYRLFETLGLRIGELMGIKVKDVNFQDGILTIHRRPDDKEDTRADTAHQKTNARDLKIRSDLTRMISDYVKNYRSKVDGAKSHNFLIVSHVKSKSPAGAPISRSSISRVFKQVALVSEILWMFHPHMMRHTWNDMFSALCDKRIKEGLMTVEEEEQNRRYLMGWSDNSKMAGRYSKRHIKEKANQASMDLQDMLTPESIEARQENRNGK